MGGSLVSWTAPHRPEPTTIARGRERYPVCRELSSDLDAAGGGVLVDSRCNKGKNFAPGVGHGGNGGVDRGNEVGLTSLDGGCFVLAISLDLVYPDGLPLLG